MREQEVLQGANVGIPIALAAAQGFADPLADLGALFSIGSLFGPPPAMAFPEAVRDQLVQQITQALPPPLPIPPTATPAQQEAIRRANDLIGSLDPAVSVGPYTQGNQSAQSWRNTLQNIVAGVRQGFGQLGQLYTPAFQAFAQAQPSSLSGQVGQLQQALAGNQLDQARSLLAQDFPTQAQAQAEQQLTHALSSGIEQVAHDPAGIAAAREGAFQSGLSREEANTIKTSLYAAPLTALQQPIQQFRFSDLVSPQSTAPELAAEFTQFGFPQAAADVIGRTEAGLIPSLSSLTRLSAFPGMGQIEDLPGGFPASPSPVAPSVSGPGLPVGGGGVRGTGPTRGQIGALTMLSRAHRGLVPVSGVSLAPQFLVGNVPLPNPSGSPQPQTVLQIVGGTPEREPGFVSGG